MLLSSPVAALPQQDLSPVAASVAPVVSVVIPTYKHRDFVAQTLASVWAQTFTNYEIIVVNDGSPDDTANVLRPFAEAGRIRYIEQSNTGQAGARNRGVAEARGEFVALLDDDDLWPADKLEWQVAALRAASPQTVMVYGRIVCINDQNEPTVPLDEAGEPVVLPWEAPQGNAFAAFARRNWIMSPGQCLVRRTALSTLTQGGGGAPFDPDPRLRGCDDWDLWWRLAQVGPFLYEDRDALLYRFHAANASRDVLQMHRSTLRVHEKYARLPADKATCHLLACARREAFAWSEFDLIRRASADRAPHGAGPFAAWEKLRFLAHTQPLSVCKPRVARLFLGTLRAMRRISVASSRRSETV